jgi:hypothetical protein
MSRSMGMWSICDLKLTIALDSFTAQQEREHRKYGQTTKDNDARNFKVALPSKRDPSKKSYYVTEHILEVSRNYHT